MARRGSRNNTRLVHTAESVGAALGQVAARLDAWSRQRAELAAEIRRVANAAQAMLSALGHSAERSAAAGLDLAGQRKGGRPKGYKTSAATKAKLRAAWKRRKSLADSPAADPAKPKRTMSPEVRAKIAAAQKKRWAAQKKG